MDGCPVSLMPEALGMYVAFGGCSGNTHGIRGTQD